MTYKRGTPMSEDDLERQNQLLWFIQGWKRGATGSATTPEQMEHNDFSLGWHAGREAAKAMYGTAQEHYGVKLSPLRSDP